VPVLNPTKIVAAPVNYIAHKEEMLVDYTVENAGFFLKSPTSIVGPEDTIRLPFSDRRQDPEVELAAIIGQRAQKIRAKDALEHIFAYTIAIDVTVRGKEDRPYRKSFDTFTPIGPWLVTPDEIGDPQNLRLRLFVNGELRQDAHTSDMVFGVAELIERASWAFPLLPGDVLMTGTPEGVSQVYPGDRIKVEIEKIGSFSIPVENAD
jgi:2-keto-4-pentenoate hydratase/2-oxohepta-3-ene-1,7-dioic acid hydratase in catechol pathway